MATYTHTIAQNDTAPNVHVTLKNPDGTVVNLTGATAIKFVMGALPAVVSINTTATVIDATNGIVEYAWQASDTATTGAFTAQFRVTDASGKVQHYPNGDYIVVNIEPTIA